MVVALPLSAMPIQLSMKLCCGDHIVPLLQCVTSCRDIHNLGIDDLEDQSFLVAQVVFLKGQVGLIPMTVGVQSDDGSSRDRWHFAPEQVGKTENSEIRSWSCL